MDANELISWFQLNYPTIVKEMKDSNHHYDEWNLNSFHLEGDVWTHTCMVMLQARDLPMHYETLVAALLHDIGKPMSREVKEETKKVRFFNHGNISPFLALPILHAGELNLSDNQKRHVCELINLHTDLFQNLVKDENGIGTPNKKILGRYKNQSENWITDMIHLVTADGLGRFCFDKYQDADYYLNWKWNFNQVRYNLPNKKFDHKITLLIGPPLAGKSTYLSQHENLGEVISRDNAIMELAKDKSSYKTAWDTVDQKEVDRVVQDRFRTARQEKKDIVVDMTNMTEKTRRKWLQQIPDYYKKRAVVFMTDFDTLHVRNLARDQEENKYIPTDVLNSMMKRFQAPLYSEFDSIQWIFN